MSGLANIAAARGIDLDEVTATVEGDINLLGILGLDDEVRNGYEAVRVVFHVKGAAEVQKLAALVEQSRRRSAVFDVITNGVPIRSTPPRPDRSVLPAQPLTWWAGGASSWSGRHGAQHGLATVLGAGRLQHHT